MRIRNVSRATAVISIVLLFAVSVLIRRSLFDRELTADHEWLSAHTLITLQLWNAVPVSIHHFNLLYTFPSRADRFIDDLWTAGVPDGSGRFYYISMPELAFLTPYSVFRAFGLPATIKSLQIFGLALHGVSSILLFLLLRYLTAGRKGSWLAAVAGYSVLLFAPTALYYYQNAMVGTLIVIPYTIAVLFCVTRLLEQDTIRRWWLFLALFISIVGGCLTDWQGYFTALAAAIVAAAVGIRDRSKRSIGWGILSACSAGVLLSISLTVAHDSAIAGWRPFIQTILSRLRVRTGAGGNGLASAYYYTHLLRSYSADAAFLVLAGVLLIIALRRERAVRVGRCGIALAISLLALVLDHVILAEHTAAHVFTTITALPLIGILCAAAVMRCVETARTPSRMVLAISGALVLSVGLSAAAYEHVYQNRPHPFAASAAKISALALPSDVIFALAPPLSTRTDYAVPQLLYYLQRNVKMVSNQGEAFQYLSAHNFDRGLLVQFEQDFNVAAITALYRTADARRSTELMPAPGGSRHADLAARTALRY